MRAVWSLWSKPMRGAYGGGWPSLHHHLLSSVLSVQTCRRFFDGAHLVADSEAATLFAERLGLHFDSISLTLDALDSADPDLWALGKLHAYSVQTQPFLHIDADVYLWKPPRGEPHAADVFTAYPELREYGQSYCRCASLKAAVHRVSGWLPEELDSYVPSASMLEAENCAMIGGNRVDFIRYYADLAIRAVDHPANRYAWKRRGSMMQDMLIFEQHMLSAVFRFHAERPGSPFAGVRLVHMFASEGDCVRDSAEAGFTHLLSRFKDDRGLLDRLSARVRRDYPDYCERIMTIAQAPQ